MTRPDLSFDKKPKTPSELAAVLCPIEGSPYQVKSPHSTGIYNVTLYMLCCEEGTENFTSSHVCMIILI